MTNFVSPFRALFFSLMMLSAAPVLAQDVGRAIDIQDEATLTTAEGTGRLTAGMGIAVGDIIETDGRGQVHLLFGDRTKMVVGPRSRLVIDDVLLRANGQAKRFTINALNGTFRFLSGDSPKQVYRIDTPTATMGIRGTVFDFFVGSDRVTSVVLYQGEVEMCPRRGGCERVVGTCSLSRTRSASVGVEDHERFGEQGVQRDDFPYVRTQSPLLESYRTSDGGCSRPILKPKKDKQPDPGPTKPEGPIDDGPIDDGPVDEGPVDDGPEDDGPEDDGPADDGPAGQEAPQSQADD